MLIDEPAISQAEHIGFLERLPITSRLFEVNPQVPMELRSLIRFPAAFGWDTRGTRLLYRWQAITANQVET
jgi:hypothetical protein